MESRAAQVRYRFDRRGRLIEDTAYKAPQMAVEAVPATPLKDEDVDRLLSQVPDAQIFSGKQFLRRKQDASADWRMAQDWQAWRNGEVRMASHVDTEVSQVAALAASEPGFANLIHSLVPLATRARTA